MRLFILSAVLNFMFSFSISLAAEDLTFSRPAVWIEEHNIPDPNPGKAAAPFQLLLIDTQTNFTESSTDSYVRTAIKVQSPEGLAAAGNVAMSWHPETGEIAVHHLRILRGDETIDILEAGQRFTILRREPNLEAATIDGVLTATLQPSGLQVGDIVDIAYTHKFHNPIFGDTASHISPLLTSYEVGELRIRFIWPESRQMRWQVTPDLPEPKVKRRKDGHELRLVMKNATPPTNFPENAPLREYLTGLLEISDIPDWSKVSSLMAPLYSTSTKLDPNSRLREEAVKIAALTSDPTERTEKVLRLVQDKIRYVFLGIDSGAYTPANADETWARRFGDCKAKTVVLLALLRELGIDAEPALVSSNFGDGLDQRLPVIGVFDHLIVKVKIGDKIHWLDGTRLGDRKLKYIITPPYKWALAIRAEGASLEPLEIPPLEEPITSIFLDIDASDGVTSATPINGRMIIHGDAAIALRQQFNNLSIDQLKETQTALWLSVDKKIYPEQMHYTFDEDAPVVTLNVTGLVEMKKNSQKNIEYFEIPGNRTGWDASNMDDSETKRTAPWLLSFPSYLKKVTVVNLPKERSRIILKGADIDQTIRRAVELKRSVTVEDNILTMQSTFRTILPELDAAQTTVFVSEMAAAYDNIAEFGFGLKNPYSTTELNGPEQNSFISAQDFINRGTEFLETEHYEEAIADFNEAIALDATQSWAFSGRGMAYYFQQEYEKSSADFRLANSLDEDNWTAIFGQGLIFYTNGDLESAIKKYDHAVKINPDFLPALFSRAYAKSEAGDLDGAIDDARTSSQRSPEDLTIKSQLALWLQARGDYEDGIAVMNQVIRQVSDEPQYYQVRADLYEDAGSISLALADHNKIVEFSKNSPSTLNSRCWFRAMNNIDIQLALEDCNRALKTRKTDANTLDSRGYVYLRLGNLENAIADFNAALAIDSEQYSSLYGRGLARLRGGDSNGNEDINHAIELSPDSVSYYEEHGLGR
ncbi:MAG: DUF3857 domain-containing protein [Alphaproteobacteria bacterium]|nr:DUF3857 domain-containing protein [Alphaproteobacteria bacterium]